MIKHSPVVILLYYKLQMRLHDLLFFLMNNKNALSQPLVESVAGFVAGVASTLVAHPLDILKTRLQGMTASQESDRFALSNIC